MAPEAETRGLYQSLLRDRHARPSLPNPGPESDRFVTAAPPADVAVSRPGLRHCVLLVASLARPTQAADPEALLAHSDNFHGTVERQIESYGGRLASRMGDTVQRLIDAGVVNTEQHVLLGDLLGWAAS